MKVLIVEDDDGVSRLLREAATEAGYTAEVAGDGETGLFLATDGDFDLILLDLMLPRLDGLTVCRRLREARVMTPVLMITARDGEADTVACLDAGADDYLVKPFRVAELLARMRALLRRGVSSPAILKVGDLTLDPSTRDATRAGKTLHLSATEYRLLEYLMRNAGRALTRSTLLDHVWQYDFGGRDNILEVYISYLRGKIDRGQPQPLIHTLRGVGYKLEARDTSGA